MYGVQPASKPSRPLKIDWVLVGIWILMLISSGATLAGFALFLEVISAWVWRVA